jgi:glutathionylspermidine synthase-like protein
LQHSVGKLATAQTDATAVCRVLPGLTRPDLGIEYNADTPTAIFEAAVFQWAWLEQASERRIIPADADQFMSA